MKKEKKPNTKSNGAAKKKLKRKKAVARRKAQKYRLDVADELRPPNTTWDQDLESGETEIL